MNLTVTPSSPTISTDTPDHDEDVPDNDEAIRLLDLAEIDFLLSFGWVRLEADKWIPPLGYRGRDDVPDVDRREYHQGHAVNSQKQDCFGMRGSHSKFK